MNYSALNGIKSELIGVEEMNGSKYHVIQFTCCGAEEDNDAINMTCYFDLYCTLHEPLLLLHHAVHQLQHLLRLLPAGERAAGAGAARPPSPSA